MDFVYTAIGIIQTHGCPGLEFNFTFLATYPVGSVAYDRISATRGKMEAVSIKRLEFVGCDAHPLYTDNLNAVYTEADLVNHNDAKNLATAYYNRKIAKIDAAIAARNC